MCGICCIITNSEEEAHYEDSRIKGLLASRGPDISYLESIQINSELSGLFRGCVLWMQGKNIQKQPMTSKEGDVYLWNGDDFDFRKNLDISDTCSLFNKIENGTEEELINCVSSIQGPWAFIYYSHQRKRIYFGRDLFGRRSLLWKIPQGNSKPEIFTLCSVFFRNSSLKEIPALGVYAADITKLFSVEDKKILLYPFIHVSNEQLCIEDLKYVTVSSIKLKCTVNIPLNKEIPTFDIIKILKNQPNSFEGENLLKIISFLKNEIDLFTETFKRAIQKRINACPPKCKNCTYSIDDCSHTKFAVLFSGGLDSALIALFLSKCLSRSETIDLLNVSFTTHNCYSTNSSKKTHENVPNFNTPDRISGKTCLKELQLIDETRTWNFVEINILSDELQEERNDIINHLIAPKASVLDDSIGCALYFCCRGIGLLNSVQYHSPARVVFSGLGADEQLAGYSRHRTKFTESGWAGLVDEIKLEMERIYSRNCGRDDRIFSHHGRTARFPYLDEEVVECLNSIPIWKKTNLFLARGIGEKILLRVVAAQNSLTSTAVLPKRAIQFGSRIAKLENNRERGSDICNRFQNLLK